MWEPTGNVRLNSVTVNITNQDCWQLRWIKLATLMKLEKQFKVALGNFVWDLKQIVELSWGLTSLLTKIQLYRDVDVV